MKNKPVEEIEKLASSIMAWMYLNDTYELSTTKANKLLALCVAKIYQETGYDFGNLNADKLGPVNYVAFRYIKPEQNGHGLQEKADPDVYEKHFQSEVAYSFGDVIDATIAKVLGRYGRFSPKQLIAISHADGEWASKVGDKSIMEKQNMLV